MHSDQRNRVFGRIYASQPRIIEKTRFLTTRASETRRFQPPSYQGYLILINFETQQFS